MKKSEILIILIIAVSGITFLHFQMNPFALLTWTETTVKDFSDSILNDVVISDNSGGEVHLPHPMKKIVDDYKDKNIPRFVAYDSSRNYLKTWLDNDNVYVQKHSFDGSELGSKIRVNEVEGTSDNVFSKVAMMKDGTFIVIWFQRSAFRDSVFLNYQIFNSNMERNGGNYKIREFIYNGSRPHVFANNADSSFWVLHIKLGGRNKGTKIFVQRIDEHGKKVDSLFRLNEQTTIKYNFGPSVAMSKNNDFVVAWTGGDKSSSNYSDIYARRYDQYGNPLGSAFKVNDDGRRIVQAQADVSFDDDSNLFIVWYDSRDNTNEETPYDYIYGQFYDASGNKVGANFPVNEPRNEDDSDPDVEYFDGAFQISWNSFIWDDRTNEIWTTKFKYEPINSGTLISSSYDTGPGGTNFDRMSWEDILPESTLIRFKIRTAASLGKIDQALWYGPSDTSDFYTVSSGEQINVIHHGDRYIQYKAFLNTFAIGTSPVLNSVSITYFASDSLPPAAPENLKAEAGHSLVMLKWNANTESDLVQYRLYRGLKSNDYDSSWTKRISLSATSHIDTFVVTGTTYYYAISAEDSSHNESTLSREAFAKPYGINIYVDGSTAGSGDGSVLNPYLTIGEAIAAAVFGDTVIVLPGTYNEVVEMKNGVSLIGSGAEATRIDGTEGNTHYTVNGADDAILKGFTIVNNNMSSSAAVWCDSASTIITGNVILAKDMGINLQKSSPTIVGNYIASNDLGISVYLRSRPVIKNNVMKTASAVVANMNTQSSIVNNTILFQNIAFSILHESHIDIKNNIIYGSGNGGSLGIRCNESVVTVSYTDFVNILEKYQISHGNGTITEESGVISQNPGFVNIAKGDYRLQESSPCIDAGDPELIYEDIDGTRNDMGAFGGSTPMDPSLTMRLAKSVGISSVSGFPGDTVYTFITVDNPAGLAKAHFIVFYDKSLLTAEPVRLMPTTKDFILSQNVSNAGIIDISLQKSTEIDSGDSKILKLSFIVNKNTISGQACPLEFKNAALFDGDQKAIKIKSISDGAFVVNLGSGIGRYVYVDGKNENNGDGSREHPFRKIQEAINHASVGDTIVVASGDYAEQPTIRKEIYLRGAGASVTSIVVKPDYDAVSFIGVQKGEISGFTIKVSEESYSMGTAISCESSSPVIARNRIEYYMGDLGVICRDNSNPVIEENAVINAGIEIFSSRPVIRKNFIQAYETEGIRCIDSSFAFIVGNKVSSGNYSGLPAVSVINSGATFINNLLYCTEGEGRAVMLSDASNVKIKNCVIADKGNDGIGVDIRNSSDVQIINNTIHAKKKGLAEKSSSTIIENNIISGSQVFGVQVSNTSALSFNDVWGNGTNYDNCLPGENDISDDPLFVDESENDFHLAPGSPCVNAGNPAAQYNDPDGTRNDMGAFGGPDGGSKWMTSAGASLKVPSVNAAYRDTVYLPITGNTIAGVADIDLVLSYDVKTLSFLGANTTDITNGFSLTKTEMTKNMEKLSLSSPTGIKANAGDVVELLFAVKASSDANSYIRFNHASLRDEVSIDRSISKLENGKIIITETGVKDRAKSEPFSFHLFQNYPNPFNSSTTLKFQIPMNAHVSLKIYDILGREVRTLVESYQEAGTHRIVWNGQDNQGIQVTSGVYFIQIKAGKFIQTRKILFVK